MRLTFLVAFIFGGCGEKDDGTARVKCEEGSIAIDGECVVGGSGYDGEDDDGGTGGSGGGTGGTTGGTTGGGTTGGGGVSIDATLEILSPATGTRFESDDKWVEVTFDVDGCTLKSPDSSGDGCHIHRTINGAAYNDPSTVEEPLGWDHYSSDPMSLYLGDPGGKNIRLVLVRNDGSNEPFSPQISDTISVILNAPEDTDTGVSDTGVSDTGVVTDTGSSDTGSSDTASPEGEPACLVDGDCLTGIADEVTCGAVGGVWYETGCGDVTGDDGAGDDAAGDDGAGDDAGGDDVSGGSVETDGGSEDGTAAGDDDSATTDGSATDDSDGT